MMKNEALVDRIERLSIPEPNSGCWLWVGGRNGQGYGRLKVGKKIIGAHRASYAAFKGEIGDLWVLHKCDNPPCVNPDHLFLGTIHDNNEDRDRNGRCHKWDGARTGAANPRSKLDAVRVVEIRDKYAEGRSARSLGEEYGISQYQAWAVASGNAWATVPMHTKGNRRP